MILHHLYPEKLHDRSLHHVLHRHHQDGGLCRLISVGKSLLYKSIYWIRMIGLYWFLNKIKISVHFFIFFLSVSMKLTTCILIQQPILLLGIIHNNCQPFFSKVYKEYTFWKPPPPSKSVHQPFWIINGSAMFYILIHYYTDSIV